MEPQTPHTSPPRKFLPVEVAGKDLPLGGLGRCWQAPFVRKMARIRSCPLVDLEFGRSRGEAFVGQSGLRDPNPSYWGSRVRRSKAWGQLRE